MRSTLLLGTAVAALALSACGGDDRAVPATGTPAASTTAAATAADGYRAVSDVTAHAAIGRDAAEIRAILAPAKEGGEADFDAAAAIWTDGRHSQKSDGSRRTLAGFVEGSEIADHVADALAGNGSAASLTAAQRRQWIDKGITVALRAKVLEELDAAQEKLAAGEVDRDEGAPHNVDEAWAFFVADGEGIEATAKKRAVDFGLGETELSDAVSAALADAQRIALSGDEAGFATARDRVRGAMNRVFALAVIKYAALNADDPIAREEGRAFAWALEGELPPDARTAVRAAFSAAAEADSGTAVAELLRRHADALAVDGALPAYEG